MTCVSNAASLSNILPNVFRWEASALVIYLDVFQTSGICTWLKRQKLYCTSMLPSRAAISSNTILDVPVAVVFRCLSRHQTSALDFRRWAEGTAHFMDNCNASCGRGLSFSPALSDLLGGAESGLCILLAERNMGMWLMYIKVSVYVCFNVCTP